MYELGEMRNDGANRRAAIVIPTAGLSGEVIFGSPDCRVEIGLWLAKAAPLGLDGVKMVGKGPGIVTALRDLVRGTPAEARKEYHPGNAYDAGLAAIIRQQRELILAAVDAIRLALREPAIPATATDRQGSLLESG